MPAPPLKPTAETAQNVVFCYFHETNAHTGSTCPKNLRMNYIMGYANTPPNSSFVPTPISNVVLPQTNNFDGDSAMGYFDSEPVIAEDPHQHSIAINHENFPTPMFTHDQHLKAQKEEEERLKSKEKGK